MKQKIFIMIISMLVFMNLFAGPNDTDAEEAIIKAELLSYLDSMNMDYEMQEVIDIVEEYDDDYIREAIQMFVPSEPSGDPWWEFLQEYFHMWA